MKILITGISGFLGSALASHFVNEAHEVKALIRTNSSMRRIQKIRSNISTVIAETPVEINEALVNFAPDVVIHTACVYGRSGENPLQIFQANEALGMSLIQAILNSRKRTVFLNTGTVLDENVSFYALSKNNFSRWGARLAGQQSNYLQFIDIKLQHMFGPWDDQSKFITHVLKNCIENCSELRLTPGTQQRDFIYIADVVNAYSTILLNTNKFADADFIDVGSGSAPSVREVVEKIHRITGSNTNLAFGAISYRPEEAMYCIADTNRLRSLGWRRQYSIETGIKEIIRQEFIK